MLASPFGPAPLASRLCRRRIHSCIAHRSHPSPRAQAATRATSHLARGSSCSTRAVLVTAARLAPEPPLGPSSCRTRPPWSLLTCCGCWSPSFVASGVVSLRRAARFASAGRRERERVGGAVVLWIRIRPGHGVFFLFFINQLGPHFLSHTHMHDLCISLVSRCSLANIGHYESYRIICKK